jgi:hypothetical protein
MNFTMLEFFASHWDAYHRLHIYQSCTSICMWEESKSALLSSLQRPDQIFALSEAVTEIFRRKKPTKQRQSP